MEICVGNLPGAVTRDDLREVFEYFGRVETTDVVRHRHGGESGAIGFVGMPSRYEATSAVLGLHGRNWNGQAITATEIRPVDPVSGACCTRCHCRRETPADAEPVSTESRREGADHGTSTNESQ